MALLPQIFYQNHEFLAKHQEFSCVAAYNPNKAQFQDFKPFWEFVAGPLNAGTFGPNQLENTFGPELIFQSLPPGTAANRPPSEGLQFFGAVKIDGVSKVMTVSLRNLMGQVVYSVDLPPEA